MKVVRAGAVAVALAAFAALAAWVLVRYVTLD
jgi:hypothetical protein